MCHCACYTYICCFWWEFPSTHNLNKVIYYHGPHTSIAGYTIKTCNRCSANVAKTHLLTNCQTKGGNKVINRIRAKCEQISFDPKTVKPQLKIPQWNNQIFRWVFCLWFRGKVRKLLWISKITLSPWTPICLFEVFPAINIFSWLTSARHNKKWNEWDLRPPLCTYRLNWARRTSWGWWNECDDTALQTQDSKFEPWRSEAKHLTSRSRRFPTILYLYEWVGEKHFLFFARLPSRQLLPLHQGPRPHGTIIARGIP